MADHPAPVTPDARLIWRDGQLVRWQDATLHVMSHVVHYGSSVFEGIRCYEIARRTARSSAGASTCGACSTRAAFYPHRCASARRAVAGAVDTVWATASGTATSPVVVRTASRWDSSSTCRPRRSSSPMRGALPRTTRLRAGVNVVRVELAPRSRPTPCQRGQGGRDYLISQLSDEARTRRLRPSDRARQLRHISEGSGETSSISCATDASLHERPRRGDLAASPARLGHPHAPRVCLGSPSTWRALPREFCYVADEAFSRHRRRAPRPSARATASLLWREARDARHPAALPGHRARASSRSYAWRRPVPSRRADGAQCAPPSPSRGLEPPGPGRRARGRSGTSWRVRWPRFALLYGYTCRDGGALTRRVERRPRGRGGALFDAWPRARAPAGGDA
jgi:branched-chain amino acid aminotransferase